MLKLVCSLNLQHTYQDQVAFADNLDIGDLARFADAFSNYQQHTRKKKKHCS